MRRSAGHGVEPSTGNPELGPLAPLVEAIAQRTAAVVAERLGTRTQPPEPEQLVDVAEAALRLAVSRHAVYKLAESGSLPSVKLGGRLRFRPADLHAYVERNLRSDERVDEVTRHVRRKELRG